MIRISYVSRSLVTAHSESMAALAETSISRNRLNRITGFLYFDGRVFLQILEGPAAPLLRIYAAINCDTRHEDLAEIERTTVDKRRFADWSMGLLDGASEQRALRERFGEITYDILARQSPGAVLGFFETAGQA